MVEHEPQRLDWSRTETRLTATPSCSAARRLAASRSRRASRRRKSPTRRSTCGASPATQSSGSPSVAGLGPDRAAHARPVHDAMLDAAQRHDRAVGERRGLRQAAQPRRDPAAVLLRELLGLAHAAARRHGEDDLAGRGVDAQRVAARLAVAAHAHRIDRLVEDDLDRLRLGSAGDRARRAATCVEAPESCGVRRIAASIGCAHGCATDRHSATVSIRDRRVGRLRHDGRRG